MTPDGRLIVAPLPVGLLGHFGPELMRFILHQYYQGQVTADRITILLNDLGLVISKRQVLHLLRGDVTLFADEAKAVLRAGYQDYVINAEALAHMRQHHLSGLVINELDGHEQKIFADHAAWSQHLDQLGISQLEAHPLNAAIALRSAVKIATEGALFGSIHAHGLLQDTVIVSDGAGLFRLVTLDRLLARLLARMDELLLVLDQPEIPLHTNGSENDVR